MKNINNLDLENSLELEMLELSARLQEKIKLMAVNISDEMICKITDISINDLDELLNSKTSDIVTLQYIISCINVYKKICNKDMYNHIDDYELLNDDNLHVYSSNTKKVLKRGAGNGDN